MYDDLAEIAEISGIHIRHDEGLKDERLINEL